MSDSLPARIVAALKESARPMSDAELRVSTGAKLHQTVNGCCRRLAERGLLERGANSGGTIVNRLTPNYADLPLAGATSTEQQTAEAVMLLKLGELLGVELAPKPLLSPSDAKINVDGVSADGSVLVECWAHRGIAKVAQKWKLVNDATKLHWAATWLDPTPTRLILCVCDEDAVKHLRGKAWQGRAIEDLGVDVVVVDLDDETVAALTAAQARQGDVTSYARRDRRAT